MPGPAPMPIERKRKLGNPGQRKLPSMTVLPTQTVDLIRPDSLGPEGSSFWDRAVEFCGSWLRSGDAALLTLTAEALDRRAYFLSVLANDGWHVVTDKGYPYKHPLVGPLADLELQIGRWLGQLGMTPADRTRLGVAEVKAVSKLEALRAKAR